MSDQMSFFDGRIVAFCFLSQLGGLHWVGITISILDEKMAHKKRAVGQEDSCTLCFHFRPTPLQKALGGKLKDGALAHLLAFSLGSFQRKEIENHWEPFWSKLCTTRHVKTLHNVSDEREGLCMNVCIQIDDRGEKPGCFGSFCDFFSQSLQPRSQQPLCSSALFNESYNEDKSS